MPADTLHNQRSHAFYNQSDNIYAQFFLDFILSREIHPPTIFHFIHVGHSLTESRLNGHS